METIVQLKEKEYQSLVSQARLNKEEIKNKALEMYEEKGTFRIKVESRFFNKDGIYFKPEIKKPYINEGYDFKVDDLELQQVIEFMTEVMEDSFEDDFGQQIKHVNTYQDKLKVLDRDMKFYNKIFVGSILLATLTTLFMIFK